MPEISKQFIIFVNADKAILLQKRNYAAVWQGLWSFPELDLTTDITQLARHFSFTIKNKQKLDVIKHVFSHYILYIHPVDVEVDVPRKLQEDHVTWYQTENKLGLPRPVDRLIQLVSKL